MANQPEYNVTVLYGERVFEEPKYTLYRMSNGEGKLFSEFGTISGMSYEEMYLMARSAGMKVQIA